MTKYRVVIQNNEIDPVTVFELIGTDTSDARSWRVVDLFRTLPKAFIELSRVGVDISTFHVAGKKFSPVTLQNF